MWFKAIFGPTLYRIYQLGSEPSHVYEPNIAESFADSVIKWVKICCSISYWTSPLLLTFLYRRGTFTAPGLVSLGNYGIGLGILVIVAVFVRAFGRLMNQEYRSFLQVLTNAQANFTSNTKSQLGRYDFDFSAWPVDFDARTYLSGIPLQSHSSSGNTIGAMDRLTSLPMSMLSYICVHTFGRRMLYPGALSIIQALVATSLGDGREKLVEQFRGTRAKVHTVDGNDIDTMFVDRRKEPASENGRFLVICSEGNAGYYEVGCMSTPLDAGYSVLGWNHPGFWGSTGIPLPSQEQNAIDAVMQYAIHRLDFKPESVILFAWSIGGYAATWAAMTYVDVRHVILDATFDDIEPLAVARMPVSWRTLVEKTVKTHLNLNNAEQLLRYPGPVLLIRRARDEMITTIDPSVISSNRGNILLMKLLKHRYPCLVDEGTVSALREWLSFDKPGQTAVWQKYNVRDDWCSAIFKSYYDVNTTTCFPSRIGEGLSLNEKNQLTLFLASKYMEEYESTHCSPLPTLFFHDPWREGK